MIPLISIMTQFLLVALLVTAVALGAAIAYFFSRARQAEALERLSRADRDELQRRDTELAAIRMRIEEIYERQQTGSQTQHAIIQQQIEQVQHHLKGRSRQVEGIQSELRHEIAKREAEMDELRGQLQMAIQTIREVALEARERPALPPAQVAESQADRFGTAGSDESAAGPADEAPEFVAEHEAQASAAEHQVNEVVAASEVTEQIEDAADQELLGLFHDGSARDAQPVEESDKEEAPMETPSRKESSEAATPMGDDAPAGDGHTREPAPPGAQTYDDDDSDSVIQWTFLGEAAKDGHPGGPEPREPSRTEVAPGFSGGDGVATEPEAPAEPARPAPPGAEDLTPMPMIDQQRQRQLYDAGILSISEIARFTEADARRLAAVLPDLEVEEILNEWVFTAQSVLFDRYQAELRAKRAGAA